MQERTRKTIENLSKELDKSEGVSSHILNQATRVNQIACDYWHTSVQMYGDTRINEADQRVIWSCESHSWIDYYWFFPGRVQ